MTWLKELGKRKRNISFQFDEEENINRRRSNIRTSPGFPGNHCTRAIVQLSSVAEWEVAYVMIRIIFDCQFGSFFAKRNWSNSYQQYLYFALHRAEVRTFICSQKSSLLFQKRRSSYLKKSVCVCVRARCSINYRLYSFSPILYRVQVQ